MKLNKMPITKNNELYERYLHGKLIPVGFLERDFFGEAGCCKSLKSNNLSQKQHFQKAKYFLIALNKKYRKDYNFNQIVQTGSH